MAFQEPRRQTEDLFLVCVENLYRTAQEATPRSFTPSTMTGTTIVDASVAASHVGCYVIPEDGDARGQVRQIISISGTTATVDASWNSTANVTKIRVWTPADVPWRLTGSGSTTTIVSSTHAGDGTNFWVAKGYHAIAIGGQNAGIASAVSAFTTGTGTATITDAVTSTNTGELWLMRKMLRPEPDSLTVTVDRASSDRGIVGFADADVQTPLLYSGSAAFTLPLRGLSAAAASTVVAVRPREMGDLLAAIMTETLDTGALAHATAPGTSPSLVLSGAPTMTVGGFVLASTGEAGQIRAINSATLTVGNTSSAGPTSHVTSLSVAGGSNVYASAWYKRKDTGFQTFTIDYFRGGLFRQILQGCMPTLSLSVTRDNVVRFMWNYTAGEAFEYTRTRYVTKAATLPLTILDTTVPTDAKGSRCLFNNFNVLLNDLTLDFGFKPAVRQSAVGVNGADGYTMTLGPMTGSFKIMADEDDRTSFEDVCDLLNRRACLDFLLQKGSAPTETFALAIPAMQITSAPQSYTDGQSYYTATFKVVMPQAVPGNSFGVAVPPFAMGWL